MTETPHDEANPQPPQRASLTGKGWEILRGTEPPEDPASVHDSAEPGATAEESLSAPELTKFNASPPPDPQAFEALDELLEPPPALEEEIPPPEETEAIPQVEAQMSGLPLVQSGYQPDPKVEALIAAEPEEIAGPEGESEPGIEQEIVVYNESGGAEGAGLLVAAGAASPGLQERDDAIILPQDARIDAGRLAPVTSRTPAEELFADAQQVDPDENLLDQFVTDERLHKLWKEIEKLQEEIIYSVQGDRQLTDIYQQELLQASALLLQDRANYDDVRAILYRVRADLMREQKVREDISRYKPQILRFLLFMLFLWLVLMVLEPAFRTFMADVVGMEALGVVYHPMLFGMLGAIIFAYFTLNKHAIVQRDFDPAHVSWYLMNPVIGVVMGLLMTLVFGTGIVSTIGLGVLESAEAGQVMGQYPFLLWVLCFLAGYNQNVVLRLLNRTFSFLRSGTTSAGDDTTASEERPSTPAS